MFDRWFDSYRWWWCALSGLLLVLGFAPFSLATCGWITLVPAWWVLTRSERARRQPIRHGYLAGLIYFGGVFWWIGNVTAVGTFFLVLYLALYPACWFLFVARLVLPRPGERSLHVLLQAPAAAALWVLLEWWRSWFLTGFNWNELGDSQAASIVFRQLAAYGGVHLISFVLVTVNLLWAEGLLAMAETLREKRVVRASLPFAAALVIVACCFALGAHHLQRHNGEKPGPALKYACVQPNIPQIVYDAAAKTEFQHTQDEALQTEVTLSNQAIAGHPDLLIWPEAIIDEGVFQDRPLNDAVHDICESYGGYFLLGSQDFDIAAGRKLYNCAYLFGPHGETYEEYRKTRLVILGEVLPLGDRFPWLRKLVGIGMDFTPGPGPVKFTLAKPGLTLAPLICFEDTLPEVTDKASQLHPDFFVTITNDGWYQGWCAAWGVRQHLGHAIFRSVEHDRPMIRCANNGISCQVDPDGTVVGTERGASVSGVDTGGVYFGTLQTYPVHVTLYEKWGDWIVLISALGGVMLMLRSWRRKLA